MRVRIDFVDHSETFSVDLDQRSRFMGKFVTPGAEKSFGEFELLVAMCKSAIVFLFAALICEVTWIEPHRKLFVILTKIPLPVERNI